MAIKRKLTKKQRTFIGEYLIDLNATQAAIRAGYKENRAKEMGYENLTKPHIAAAITEAVKQRAERTKIKTDDILQDLREVADVCLGRRSTTTTKEGVDEDGLPYKVKEEVTKFTASGAIKALETIGKHLGMFSGDDNSEDANAIFIAGVRSFITSTKMLPKDQVKGER